MNFESSLDLVIKNLLTIQNGLKLLHFAVEKKKYKILEEICIHSNIDVVDSVIFSSYI